MKNPLKDVTDFLRRAGKIAVKQGCGDLEFSISDLGDYFHVKGKSGTPRDFVAFLLRINQIRDSLARSHKIV